MSYADEMAEGERALNAGDHAQAYRAFCRAHDVGHAVKRDHLAAHRGMIRAAIRSGRLDRAAKNALMMSAAALFDRDQSKAAAAP